METEARAKDRIFWLALGAGTAALALYFFDPISGRRRRALALDQLRHYRRLSKRAFSRQAVNFENRLRGWFTKLVRWLEPDTTPDNETLALRARSELGHVARHIRELRIQADAGLVTIEGACEADEREEVIEALKRVRGVRKIHDGLKPRELASAKKMAKS